MFTTLLRTIHTQAPLLSSRSIRCAQWLSTNSAAHLGDALSTDGSIETVPLVFDKHSPKNKVEEAKAPIIILHGIFGSKANTRSVAKQLASKLSREIYCLDLRNFGDSPHNKRLDNPSLAADVERFIDESKFTKKPILVGHSMGAKTVMAVALRRPELPRMIVAVDNAPLDLSAGSTSVFSKYINLLRTSIEHHNYTNIKDVDRDLAAVEPKLEVRQFLLTNLVRGKTEDPITSKIPLEIVGDAIVTGKIAAWPYDFNVSRWTGGPALFIRGTESGYVPDELIPDIGRYFPNFEVRDIESGHWVISEKPKEFIDVLLTFIEKQEDE